jgi:gliding-associated putative ABC transporter substrate-binding component GldG
MEKQELKMKDFNVHKTIRLTSWMQFIVAASLAIVASGVSSLLNLRVDLTEDKRYTLSKPTREILEDLENDVFIQVYLDGEMPIPLKRLKRSVKEVLDEFRVASRRRVDYEFINPSGGKDEKQRNAVYETLIRKGLRQVNVRSGDEEGGSSQKLIFPGMIVNYNGIEMPVNFLKNNPAFNPEQNLLHSVEGLEYETIQSISTLSSDTIYRVAFIEGHNEFPEIEVADITFNLARYFTVDRGVIGGKQGILDNYAAIIIAGPESEFGEKDKFVIDQYVMNGGKVLWLIEEVLVNSDSLASGETVALYRPLGIEDQLFRYGVRINPVVVQDMDCMVIRLAVMSGGTRQQILPAPWIYFPLLNPVADHPVTRNINKVKGEFVNYMDTVGLDPEIKKTILLTSSPLSRIVTPPVVIRLKETEVIPGKDEFNRSKLPVAVLLEGNFQSAFRNRMTASLIDDQTFKQKNESPSTKMIVIADGDIIRNDVHRTGTAESPYQLGTDRYTGEVFGNKDFILNCLNYLIDDKGIMELRSRELKLRQLDKNRIRQERYTWQFINTAGPVLLVVLAGIIYAFIRRKTFAKD